MIEKPNPLLPFPYEPEEEEPVITQTIQDMNPDEKVVTTLSFNDIDSVLDETNQIKEIEAPIHREIRRTQHLSCDGK